MTKVQYKIVNKTSGADMGLFEADSEDDALDGMSRDAGYKDFADACDAIGSDPIEARDDLAVSSAV